MLSQQFSPPEQRFILDLSSWRAAGNAAEPINPDAMWDFTLKLFTRTG